MTENVTQILDLALDPKANLCHIACCSDMVAICGHALEPTEGNCGLAYTDTCPTCDRTICPLCLTLVDGKCRCEEWVGTPTHA